MGRKPKPKESILIRVKVSPESKKRMFSQKGKDSYVASVLEPTERNLANKALVIMVSEHFKVPTNKVRILSGHHSKSKILSIEVAPLGSSLLIGQGHKAQI